MELQQFKGQERSELSMIEVAYAILEETGDVHDFTKLLEKVQKYLGLPESDLEDKMVRFYTNINIDGRFISLGDNRWGLRSWYAIDSIDEEIVNSIDDEDLPRHQRKKTLNAFDDGEGDMIDYNADDPEDEDNMYDPLDDKDEEEIGPVSDDNEVDDDEDDEELSAYASDLNELGDEDVDLDESEDFDEEFDDEEEEDEEFDEEDDD